MAHIFISYATSDRAIAAEVSGWLRAAGHVPFLDDDLRDGINVGEDWKQRLYRELRQVDAVIGVVTSSFVASHWSFAELGIADALGCQLIALRAEAGVVHPLMQDLQYANYQADPQQARDRVLQAVRLLDDGGGTWREGDNPFPGLEPFTAALSRVFFGRAAETREVANRVRAMGSIGGILAIVGPSGCGKSSLLNAAVVPLLDSDPAWLTVPTLLPGSDPLPELARVLAATATRLGLGWSASDVRAMLEAGVDGLRWVADDLLAVGPGTHQRRLLVSIDQVDELFTRTTPAARQRFAQLLQNAVAGPVQVVVAMRSEFLDDLRNLPALAGVPVETYVLAPLDQEMLRDVIEQPAKVARLRLENGLAAQLVADTESGEALPLLAFTLRQLADGLPAGGTLTLARYHDLDGVSGALTRHADAALVEAVRASGLTEREVLAGLTRLVTVEETGRRARRRVKLTGLAEPLRVALQVFVDRRLLLSDTDDDGQVWLTLAHEALLTGRNVVSASDDRAVPIWDSALVRVPSRVFLSYSFHNRPAAESLSSALTQRGVKVWTADVIPPGEPIAASISTALEASDVIAFLLSGQRNESPWIQREIAAAVARSEAGHAAIVSVLLTPNTELPFFLRRYAAIRLMDGVDPSEQLADVADQIVAVMPRPLDRIESERRDEFNLLMNEEALLEVEKRAYSSAAGHLIERLSKLLAHSLLSVLVGIVIFFAVSTVLGQDFWVALTAASLLVGIALVFGRINSRSIGSPPNGSEPPSGESSATLFPGKGRRG